jgi:DNA-binding protein H-NS
MEATMAKQSNLASLSIGALVKMRDDIGSILSSRAESLKRELRAIGSDYKEVGRIAVYGKRKTKGKKVTAKYRDNDGNEWAGRGAQPRWMTAAIKAGKKRDDFLIIKTAKKAQAKGAKRKTK